MTRITVPVKDAYVTGRNGHFDLKEIEIIDNGQRVWIVGISKARNVCINGGFGFLNPEEMDQLATQWLRSRKREVCPSCGNSTHEKLRWTGERKWTADGIDGMIECLDCGDEFWVLCIGYETVGGEKE